MFRRGQRTAARGSEKLPGRNRAALTVSGNYLPGGVPLGAIGVVLGAIGVVPAPEEPLLIPPPDEAVPDELGVWWRTCLVWWVL
jgi:hypothetical protein